MVSLLLLLPQMTADDRHLLLSMAELLAATDGSYRDHIRMEIRILECAARAGSKHTTCTIGGEDSRVIPFPRRVSGLEVYK